MYFGDGSYANYNKSEYEIEYSLTNLLEAEKELVEEYNQAVQAYNTAKRNGIRTNECKEKIVFIRTKLEDARTKIRVHCEEKFGFKTDFGDSLYVE